MRSNGASIERDHGASPAPFEEPHFTAAQIGEKWTLSTDVVRKLFEKEPGVLVIGEDHFSLYRGRRWLPPIYANPPIFGNSSNMESRPFLAYHVPQAHQDLCPPFRRKEVPLLPLPDLGRRILRPRRNPQEPCHPRLVDGARNRSPMGGRGTGAARARGNHRYSGMGAILGRC